MTIGHVFLSPHFDDAIGSCGGTIARLVRRGHAVRILTAFGGMEREPFSPIAEILHGEWKLERPVRQRRLEDASACRILGCESTFFDFLDAIYRQGADGSHLYPTFDALRGSLAPEDDRLADRLAAQIIGELHDSQTVVYCPLAVGGHVDHVVARDCGAILEGRGRTIVYYKDFYYRGNGTGATGLVPVTLTVREVERKVAAFSQYRSQISDLFGSEAGMRSYFAGAGRDETMLPSRQSLATLQSVLTRKPWRRDGAARPLDT